MCKSVCIVLAHRWEITFFCIFTTASVIFNDYFARFVNSFVLFDVKRQRQRSNSTGM